jgi:tetratricopeptide (TPR) repeat protein
MSWPQTEYILKGIYLGLLVFVGMQLHERGDWWLELGYVALCTFAGLALFLGVAAVRKLREGYRVRGRLLPFLLFLLLENPVLVYAGVLLGLAVGAFTVPEVFGQGQVRTEDPEHWQLAATVGGGAVLGYVFWMVRHVHDRKIRFYVGLALIAGLVGGAIALFWYNPQDPNGHALLGPERQKMIATLLLVGIPLFYLLTFAGMVEESEIEIAAICAALGVGLWVLASGGEPVSGASPSAQTIALAVPLALYFLYSRRILPGLRVFKHVLRGISYANVGRYRPALISLNRALQLDPKNTLAREHLWSVHRQMDLNQVLTDPETLALVNFELCLERVGWLLLLVKPTPDNLAEAHRLLDLVGSQRPEMQPRCDYWRAVAHCHERDYDRAAEALESVLAARSSEPDNPHRRLILVQAWQLALLQHPEMIRRVGAPQVAEPGRRMEAIAAVERRLAVGNDEDVWALKRLLYNDLTEAEYLEAVEPDKPAGHFDHEYCRQLGLALIADPNRWERGGEYLRLAAHGLQNLGPGLYVQIAQASERAGNFKGVWQNYELAKLAGRSAGPKNLSAEERALYFAVVKALAEDADKHDELDKAIEDYRLYTEFERAGLETYRTLAGLYERNKDPWGALHATEQGLVYDSTDKDLLERKDRYYYSVSPEEVRQRWDDVRKWFDVNYCLEKARWILDKQAEDLELLDWAEHLVRLAQVVRSESLAVRVLRARILRRRGEVAQAIDMLEEVRVNRPEKFPSTDEEDAWYLSNRLLGDLYLHEKPDVAVECFQEYRKSPKSGADTLYKLGVAYENLGDRPKAVKCYQLVAAYESHPLAPEANDALNRLRQPAG